jgi:hypothetical protein
VARRHPRPGPGPARSAPARGARRHLRASWRPQRPRFRAARAGVTMVEGRGPAAPGAGAGLRNRPGDPSDPARAASGVGLGAQRRRGLGGAGGTCRRGAARIGRARLGARPGPPLAGQPPGLARAAPRRGGGAAALRPAPASLHLGAHRSAASVGRPRHPRRAQRRRVAAAADSGSLAGAAGPPRARSAQPGAPDRPCRARFRKRARRPRGARHPCPARRALARHRLALLAAAGGDDGRSHPLAPTPQLGAGARPAARVQPRRAPCAEPGGGAAAAADCRHRRRPAQGRSLRLLCAQDAGLRAARPDRRRSQRRLARQRGPQGARSLDEGGRVRALRGSGPAPRPCWGIPPPTR